MNILTVLFLLMPTAPAKIVDKVVAVVDAEPILMSNVDEFSKRLASGGLVDEVKRKNMEVTIERVEQEIRNISKTNNYTRAQMASALAAKGVSMSQYQDFMKSTLQRQGLIEREVLSRVRISEEDVSSYYLAKKGPSGAQIFEYQLSHILFVPKNGNDAEALTRARAVEDKLKAGESFDKLAERHSEDSNFAKGGSLGTFRAGEMLKELEDAVHRIGPGDITPVIKTALGYQIVKVTKRTLIADPAFEDERAGIQQVLQNEALKRQFHIWLTQRRDDAAITINGL